MGSTFKHKGNTTKYSKEYTVKHLVKSYVNYAGSLSLHIYMYYNGHWSWLLSLVSVYSCSEVAAY